MISSKVMTYILIAITILNSVVSLVPAPYQAIVTVVLAALTGISHSVSHSDAALAGAGYAKVK